MMWRSLLVYAATFLFFYNKGDLMNKYELMNNGVVAILAVLFVLYLWIVVADMRKKPAPKPVKSAARPVVKPRVYMELMYPSTLNDRMLCMPVYSLQHAQDLVHTMSLNEANLGYRRSTDGSAVILYSLDADRVLQRVSEVV